MKKKKLELKKKIVAALSDTQKAKILGGDIDETYDCETNVPGDCATEFPEYSWCAEPCESQTCMSECDLPTCNPANCA